MPSEPSTPITSSPAAATGTAIRPARRERLLDVEVDVLRDARAPRVVEARDGVVGARGGHEGRWYSRPRGRPGARNRGSERDRCGRDGRRGRGGARSLSGPEG